MQTFGPTSIRQNYYRGMTFCPGLKKYPVARYVPPDDPVSVMGFVEVQTSSGPIVFGHTHHCIHCLQKWSEHLGVDINLAVTKKIVACPYPCGICGQPHLERICPRVYGSARKLVGLYKWPHDSELPAHVRIRPTSDDERHLFAAGYIEEPKLGEQSRFTPKAYSLFHTERHMLLYTECARPGYEVAELIKAGDKKEAAIEQKAAEKAAEKATEKAAKQAAETATEKLEVSRSLHVPQSSSSKQSSGGSMSQSPKNFAQTPDTTTPPAVIGDHSDTSQPQLLYSSQASKPFDSSRGRATPKPPGTVHGHPQPQQHIALTQHAPPTQHVSSASHLPAPRHGKRNASPPQTSDDLDTTTFAVPRKANGKRQELSRQASTHMPHAYRESIASRSHAPLGSDGASSIEARSTPQIRPANHTTRTGGSGHTTRPAPAARTTQGGSDAKRLNIRWK